MGCLCLDTSGVAKRDSIDEIGGHVEGGFRLVHGHEMACVEDHSKLEETGTFYGADHFISNFPGGVEFFSPVEGVAVGEVLNPFGSAGSWNNEVHLSVVDEHWQSFVEKIVHAVCLWLHEVSIKVIVDLFPLRLEDHFGIE